MKFLNPNKCFVIPPKSPAPTIQIIESGNWLNTLVEICGKSLSIPDLTQLTSDFNRHVGETSTYATKALLVDGLKHLLYHLSNTENPMSDSQKAAISYKLIEGVKNCTTGFHNRVNEILSGFYLSETLDTLLLQIRQNIVLSIASNSTDDVHTHNRFYVVAQTLGYGVEPMNSHDVFQGNIRDERIQLLLKFGFELNYSIPNILNEIIKGMKGILHSQYEYTGEKSQNDGYKLHEYEKFISYLGQVLDPVKVTDSAFLIMDDTSQIVDVNWNKIKQSLLEVLLQKEYFQLDEHTKTCLLNLVGRLGEEKHPPIDATSLFMFKGLIENPEELIKLLTFLDTSSQDTQLSLILKFIDKMDTTPTGYEKIAIWAIQKEMFEKVVKPLLKKGHAVNLISLMDTIQNQAMLTRLLSSFSKLDSTEQIELLAKSDNLAGKPLFDSPPWPSCGFNALMFAAIHKPNAVEPLLAILEKIAENQASFFNENTQCYLYTLKELIRYGRAAPLLAGLEKIAPTQLANILTKTSLGEDLIERINILDHTSLAQLFAFIANFIKNQPSFFHDHQKYCFRVLNEAIARFPDVLAPLLASLEEIAPEKLFEEFTMLQDGYNKLDFLVVAQSDAIEPLLASLERIAPTKLANILTKIDRYGKNALIVAGQQKPTAIVPLLVRLEKSAPDKLSELLTKNFSEVDRVLLRAVEYERYEKMLKPYLKIIENLDPLVQIRLLTQTTHDGENALIIALQKPAALRELLKTIVRLTPEVQVKLLTPSNQRESNPLMRALENTDAVMVILETIGELTPSVQVKLFTDTTIDGDNVFRELLRRINDKEKLFNSIDKLPPDNLIKLMTHTNHQGSNVLKILAESEQNTAKLFLNKIQSLALSADSSIETKHKYCSLLKEFKRYVNPNSQDLITETDQIHEKIKRDIATINYKSQTSRFNFPDQSADFDRISSREIENITPTLWIYFLHRISVFFSALSEWIKERFSISTPSSAVNFQIKKI